MAVGGWKDHVHVFFELKPTQKICEVMQVLKANSSKWIREKRFTRGRFSWPEGYGAFACSSKDRKQVILYIMNQEEHHSQKTFREEYLEVLEEEEVDYDKRYLFEFFA